MAIDIGQIYMNILNFLAGIFKKPTHVIIPPIIVGSPEWQQPPVDNISQDWDKYLSLPYGNQFQGGYYEDNCTVYDAIEHIQALLNYYIANNPDDPVTKFLKGYYCNKEGYVKLSVRYSSKMAGIVQHVGARIDDVWNSFGIHGLVPEYVYPDPPAPFSWEQYMSEVPEGIVQYGSYSATFFKIIWTVIQNNNWNPINPDVFRKNLTTSPISWAGAIGNIDANGIEQPTPYHTYQHARLITGISDTIHVLDNYPVNGNLKRKLSMSFPVPCAIVAQVHII